MVLLIYRASKFIKAMFLDGIWLFSNRFATKKGLHKYAVGIRTENILIATLGKKLLKYF